MKNILVLIVSRNIGGMERRWAALYRQLSKKNRPYRMTFVVNRALRNQLPRKLVETGKQELSLVEYGLPFMPSSDHKGFQRILRFLDYLWLIVVLIVKFRRRHFSVVHFVTQSSLLFRKLLEAEIQVTSVVNSHTFEDVSTSKVFRDALLEGFHVDSLSSDLHSQVEQLGLTDEDHLHVAPCSFADYEETSIEKKYPWLLFVSRFVEGKGLDIFLPAVSELLQRLPELMVMIIGKGPLESYIKEKVGGITQKDRIWVGFKKEPIDILIHSMIFVSLQEKENYPSQSLLEAMVCGNAVIATDVGLTRKIIDEDVGILIDKNKDQLVDAVCKLILNKDFSEQLGKRARQRVLEEHTVDRYVEYLERIYGLGGGNSA